MSNARHQNWVEAGAERGSEGNSTHDITRLEQ